MQYDITIVGCGLTGAATALALHNDATALAIVDAHAIEGAAATVPLRGIALSDSSRRILSSIGVWKHIEQHTCAVQEIRASRKGAFGVTRIRAADANLKMLGCVIRAADLLEGLRERVLALNNLSIYSSTKVEGAVDCGTHLELSLKQNGTRHTIKTSLLILASGRQRDLSQALGFSFGYKNYRHLAVVARISSDSLEQHIAYERFTSDGLIAVLPHRPGERIIGRVYVGVEGARAMALSDADFLAQLQRDLGQRIGTIYETGKRVSYPLILCYARRTVVGRTLLLGDSAQTIHPVGGQGLNLALRDIAFLADYLYGASDPGAAHLLNRYCLKRRSDVRRVMYFTDALAELCVGLKQPLAPVLGGALSILDMAPPLRRLLVRKTLGLSPPWPRLACGLSLGATPCRNPNRA